MLVKFLPHQVAKHWDEIGGAVKEAAPRVFGESVEKSNNILDLILAGEIICWISYNKENQVNGVVTTMITYDRLSEVKNLLIYSITSIGNTQLEDFDAALSKLREYAKSLDCKRVIAYSDNKEICLYVKRIGGKTSQRFLEIPLK